MLFRQSFHHLCGQTPRLKCESVYRHPSYGYKYVEHVEVSINVGNSKWMVYTGQSHLEMDEILRNITMLY